jgi:hypothetical protein
VVTVTTWIQDYPALPGSADSAARLADTVTAEHLPGRRADAGPLVRQLFECALARSNSASVVKLITVVDSLRARFEVHYLNDLNVPDPLSAHQAVSALSDACGEERKHDGRMIYAELRDYS